MGLVPNYCKTPPSRPFGHQSISFHLIADLLVSLSRITIALHKDLNLEMVDDITPFKYLKKKN